MKRLQVLQEDDEHSYAGKKAIISGWGDVRTKIKMVCLFISRSASSH